MGIRTAQIFYWSRFALVLSLLIFLLCLLAAVWSSPDQMGIYWTATYQARIVLFIIPPAALMTAASGLMLYRGRKTKQKSDTESRLGQIMTRLSPDERDYLQHELDTRLMGVGDDGELLSVDELLGKKRKD
ncbi:MAG: hypothetical protein CL610_00930 [Anaerolineaceae bacterium]|nr:hypothetical protein [Anaerolineaceae bacterium]